MGAAGGMPRAAAERHHCRMEVLVAVLAILVAIAILFELARRLGVPFPTLMVLGGLGLAFVPGLPTIALEPELVLLVFLPPLLFSAAVATPIRDLRANLAPIVRLSIGLVLFTMVCVAVVAHAIVPDLGWGGAFALGAIVAPTDALAATSVFRRLGAPRVVVTLIEGESLFNDATALVAYRAAVLAVVTGSFVLSDALVGFVVAAVGGIAHRGHRRPGRRRGPAPSGRPAGRGRDLARHPVRRLPAGRRLGLSGVLAAVTAGLVIGSRLGTILTPSSRVLWLSTWKMIGFVLNGFVFVLIGLELPDDPRGPRAAGRRRTSSASWCSIAVVVVGTRLAVGLRARACCPNSPRRVIARRDPAAGHDG